MKRVKEIFLNIVSAVGIALATGIWGGFFVYYLTEKQLGIYDAILSLEWWNLLIVVSMVLIIINTKSKSNKEFVCKLLDSMIMAVKSNNSNWDLRSTILMCNYRKKQKIVQYYSSAFAYSPERTAVLPLDFGVTGHAIFNKHVIIKELPINHIDTYSNGVKKYISPEINFIIAAPIFHNKKTNHVIGVLAFDSFSPMTNVNIDEKILKEMAQQFADTFSILLS